MKRASSIVAIVLTVLAIGLVTGCGKHTPKGSSAEVKELVLQIVSDQYRDQLSALCYKQLSGIPIDILETKVDHAWLAEKAKTEEPAKAALEAVDDAMQQVQVTLENIRTDKVEEEVGKIHCSGDIRMEDATDSITFTAQYNDNGELYVEVFGLGGE